jgi:hypothetical protein
LPEAATRKQPASAAKLRALISCNVEGAFKEKLRILAEFNTA